MAFSLYILLLLILSISTTLSVSYTPLDNHLINCGSTIDATVDDNRLFIADRNSQIISSPAHTTALKNENPVADSPQLYRTARLFKVPGSYAFDVKSKGTHMVRLHFSRFNSSKFDVGRVKFHVLVGGFVVLSNFSVVDLKGFVVKEYLVWVDCDKLLVSFVPSGKLSFGFVSAIEVIAAPRDLVLESAQLVKEGGVEKFDRLDKQGMEVVYRVNVGGPKVTPFNDTLWRTWIPDGEFLKSGFGSRRFFFGGHIKYQEGGASREVCPDNVYNTARVISSGNGSVPDVKMTWEFPLVGEYKYLVRMHFCDIASISLGLLRFNVYVNGYLAFENLDLASITYSLASPFYADFVVDMESSGVLNVSVGPSNRSMPNSIDGILNGVEIMKLNNSMASLDGKITEVTVLKSWPRINIGVLPPLIAIVCFLLVVSMVLQQRTDRTRNPMPWIKLPVDQSEVDLKLGSQLGRIGC